MVIYLSYSSVSETAFIIFLSLLIFFPYKLCENRMGNKLQELTKIVKASTATRHAVKV